MIEDPQLTPEEILAHRGFLADLAGLDPDRKLAHVGGKVILDLSAEQREKVLRAIQVYRKHYREIPDVRDGDCIVEICHYFLEKHRLAQAMRWDAPQGD